MNPTGISARHIGEDRDPSHPPPAFALPFPVTSVELYCPLLAISWKRFHCIDVKYCSKGLWFVLACVHASSSCHLCNGHIVGICRQFSAYSHTCPCLPVPEALTTCCGRKFPFRWEEGTHPRTPTRPPAETSPLMTTTPLCCQSAPCWLCKRTRPRGARRSFTKDQSSICWWATCLHWSQGRVLLDHGLEKVMGSCDCVWRGPFRHSLPPFPGFCFCNSESFHWVPAEDLVQRAILPADSSPSSIPGTPCVLEFGCIFAKSKMSSNYCCDFYRENKLSVLYNKTLCSRKNIMLVSREMDSFRKNKGFMVKYIWELLG